MTQISTNKTDQQSNETAITSEDDYNLIEGALLQNPRGRWFLEEYIKRNRPEDTQKLLDAIHRIENNLQQPAAPSQEEIDPIRMSIIEMSKAIAKTREEINSIKPTDEHQNQLINANEELSAIVESTEKATNTILEAAEEIQEAAWLLREAGADGEACDKIDANTTDIYTACSFQDITGQRTNKVVQALCYIENRVNAMIDIWGLSEFNAENTPIQENTDSRPDSHLLNGPALEGAGLQQGCVDDVFGAENSESTDEFESTETGQDLADSMSFDAIGSDFDSIDDISFDAISPDDAEQETSEASAVTQDQMTELEMPESAELESAEFETAEFETAEIETSELIVEDNPAAEMMADPSLETFELSETTELAQPEASFTADEAPMAMDDFETPMDTAAFQEDEMQLSTELLQPDNLEQSAIPAEDPSAFSPEQQFIAEEIHEVNPANMATSEIETADFDMSSMEDIAEPAQETSSIQPLSPSAEEMMDFGDIEVTDAEPDISFAEQEPAMDLTSDQMVEQPIEQAASPDNQTSETAMDDMMATAPQMEDPNITTPQAMDNMEEVDIDELTELQQEILTS